MDLKPYCLPYGAYYTVAMNAQNKGYATAIVNVTDNFRYGGRYTCILTASPSRTDYGAPTGYLVYDLKSNKIIDWASDRNFFYSPLTDMYTFEMQQLVSL